MSTGVVLLNFGEPAEPDRETVVDYLQRIFLANADLEDAPDPAARARQLAERRAPSLLEEYETIGGSPLNAQARAQADALQERLTERGHDAQTFVGMQYTEPFIEDAVATARSVGVDELVAFPSYPLCGPSTTILALESLQTALGEADWDVPVREVTGWHTDPLYQELRGDTIASFADERGVDLEAQETALLFSAHGTPKHYLEDGSRYVEYAIDHCQRLQDRLTLEDYFLAYQNHDNRDIPWTEPEVEETVETLGESGYARVVVDPVSFVHEQSETLLELDVELREAAEAAGLEFHRVPVPHDDSRLTETFANLLEPFLADDRSAAEAGFAQCECRARSGTMCLNAPHGD